MKAVLFALDDTLFDHKSSRRHGLLVLQSKFRELKDVTLIQLEMEHDYLLKSNYEKALDGTLSLADGAVQRIRQLCIDHGIKLDADNAKETAEQYRTVYNDHRKPLPGTKKLLTNLSAHTKLSVVTNGLTEPQFEKLKNCGIDHWFDSVIVSDMVGYAKPDKKIFLTALRRLNVKPEQVAFVGDSWDSDIVPAHELGMKAFWLNRYGSNSPDKSIATEISSYVGIDYRILLGVI